MPFLRVNAVLLISHLTFSFIAMLPVTKFLLSLEKDLLPKMIEITCALNTFYRVSRFKYQRGNNSPTCNIEVAKNFIIFNPGH